MSTRGSLLSRHYIRQLAENSLYNKAENRKIFLYHQSQPKLHHDESRFLVNLLQLYVVVDYMYIHGMLDLYVNEHSKEFYIDFVGHNGTRTIAYTSVIYFSNLRK